MWVFDIRNERFACIPRTGARCEENDHEGDSTWEDMVCETLWVVFVKGLEAAAVSLLQGINFHPSGDSQNDI